MSNKNLFKEAIADAKAVREAALANAKAALEEALTPKLQSMLAAKLNEMDYDMEEEGMKSDDEMEEGMYPEDTSDEIQDRYRATGAALEEDELEEDFDLSEILAELNDESEEEELKEAKKEKEEAGEEAEDESEEEEATEEEPTEEEGEEEDEEEVEVKDMTIEDLKDLIKDIVSQEIETETPADEEEIVPVDAMYGEMGPDVNAEEDEINLEELLAELDSLNENKDLEEDMTMAQAGLQQITDLFGGMDPQAVIVALAALPAAVIGSSKILSKIVDKAKAKKAKLGEDMTSAQYGLKQITDIFGGMDPQAVIVALASLPAAVIGGSKILSKIVDKAKAKAGKKEPVKEGIDIPSTLEMIKDLFNSAEAGVLIPPAVVAGLAKLATSVPGLKQALDKSTGGASSSKSTTGKGGALGEELEEAIETINTLRTELNETNLLNAKLLYVNKIFKAKNLTESQKLKVIASFDKATNVKEAKVVFESLNSALSTAPKKAIKESLGFASKAAGVAPNKTIVESNDVITRMQKLANIK
jgi:hypothetical protein